MVVANDATVKAGAFFPQTVKKVLRAQRIAMTFRLPLVYLVDSAGVFLPLQDEIFPDEDDFGRIFRNNAVISAMGIPQYAAVMGNCVAGGAYLPVLSDTLLITEGSQLYLAGPALVKAAIGQTGRSRRNLAAPGCTPEISGTADYREPDDHACLRAVAVAHRPAAASRSRPAREARTDVRRADAASPAAKARGRVPDRLGGRPGGIRCAGPAGLPGGCRLAAGVPRRVWPHGGDGLSPASAAGRSAWWPTSGGVPLGQRAKCRSAACCTATRPRKRPAS